MPSLKEALRLIKTFEGFNEKAFTDPTTGEEDFIIGYGTTYYPDGTQVRQGHLCTEQKAEEYLKNETDLIASEILKLNLGLDAYMLNALVSFVHSVGWESFLYSSIIDCCEQEDYVEASREITKWIYGNDHKIIGTLVDRRRHEVELFLSEYNSNAWTSNDILLKAFRNYTAAPCQVRAIRKLQERLDPYTLSEFANDFDVHNSPYTDFSSDDFDSIFTF